MMRALCVFGKELLLRELQDKAVRILAHKKRKVKEKVTKEKTKVFEKQKDVMPIIVEYIVSEFEKHPSSTSFS